jgi:hypothetical protein
LVAAAELRNSFWKFADSSSDLWKLPGKIRLQDVVSSNSEYFLCITFETQK